MPTLERLIYLAAETHPPLPGKDLLKYYRDGELLEKVASFGLMGASTEFDIPEDQVRNLYERGNHSGKASKEEFQMLLATELLEQIEQQRADIPVSEYLEITRKIADYATRTSTELIDTEEVDLADDEAFASVDQIPKWNTGFDPLDAITGGHYQSICMMIGKPGHGKTSLMLSILAGMVEAQSASSTWFFELEIPKKLMQYRIQPLRERVTFRPKKDILFCGSFTMDDIIEKAKEDPDPGRVIFIDSPDVMAGGTGEAKRFVLESIYMRLIQLKWLCQAVIVSSWPRRKDARISLESGSEAWAKAWYSDMIIGLAMLGRTRNGLHNVRLNTLKNRFGPPDQETTFQYNYGDLSWQFHGKVADDDW